MMNKFTQGPSRGSIRGARSNPFKVLGAGLACRDALLGRGGGLAGRWRGRGGGESGGLRIRYSCNTCKTAKPGQSHVPSSCFSINLSRVLHHVHSHMLASRGQSHVSKLSCAVTSFNHMNNQIACITCAESRLQAHVRSHVFCITCTVTCLHHV